MEFGVHLPLIDFGDNPHAVDHLCGYARRADRLGFTILAANDHLVFPAPWLDGIVALASVIAESGTMQLATTVGLPAVRGLASFAKSIAAIDRLSGGRALVGVGPGSSPLDYDLVGLEFDQRWNRLDEAVPALRSLWHRGPDFDGRFYSTIGVDLRPAPAPGDGPPIWIGSWGSEVGLRRVARLADGWLASAYNTTPDQFRDGWDRLRTMVAEGGKDPTTFPNALATMWFHLAETPAADDELRRRVLPVVHRPEDVLRERLAFGPAEAIVEKLLALEAAGVQTVLLWPVTDEERQLELFCEHVRPHLDRGPTRQS